MAIAMALALAAPVQASADPASDYLVKLFREACLPNIGHPEAVSTWATAQNLDAVANPEAIFMFVGRKSPGSAWLAHNASGAFALAVRAYPPSCVTYALNARASDVESGFTAIVAEQTKPDRQPRLEQDKMIPSPQGKIHSIVYRLPAVEGQPEYALTVAVSERPGGPFMGMIQAMRTVGPGPVDPMIPLPGPPHPPMPPPGAPVPGAPPPAPKN
jgi:hypothetical protein